MLLNIILLSSKIIELKKAYYLSSCDTCKRILKELDWKDELQDIKQENVDAKTLDQWYKTTQSYEALFNKRARKFKAIKETVQKDIDYRALILGEYTFLKRPVIVIGEQLFVGNSKAVVAAAGKAYQ